MEKQKKKEIFKKFRNRAFVATNTAVLTAMSIIPAVSAADGSPDLATDATTVISVMKSVMSLFTTFPLNIFLIISIIISGVAVIKRLKR